MIFQSWKLAQALLLTCRHKVRADTRRGIETAFMDASPNIIEASNRTESKQPATKAGKQSGDGGFASMLSDNQRKEVTADTAQSATTDKSANKTVVAEAPSDNTEGANTSAAEIPTQPSGTAHDKELSLLLLNNPGATVPTTGTAVDVASSTTSPEGGTVPANAGSATGTPASAMTTPGGDAIVSTLAQTAASGTSVAPVAPHQVQSAKLQAGEIPAAQSQGTEVARPAVTNAQEASQQPGQNKEASALPHGSSNSTGPLNKEGSLPGLANSVTQTASAVNAQAQESVPSAPATAPDIAAQVISGQANDTNAASSVLASAAQKPMQSKAQTGDKTPTQGAQVAATQPSQKTAETQPAVSQTLATPTAAAQSTPSTTPQTASMPETVSAQQAVPSAEKAPSERPANAVTDGLAPQTNSAAAKNGKPNTAPSGQTPNQQAQNNSASVNTGTQQPSADPTAQPIRSDMPVDIALPMDVDGAPELLTTAGLQERVHNNLPQTTLNLRFAPGQTPVIAPNDLALHIARQVQDGTTRFEIRIDPPEMGRIEVQMDMRSQKPVQAHLFVERAETLDLLQRDARQLERALQNLGIDVDSNSLSFSLRDGNTDTAGQNGDQNSGLQSAYQVDEKDNGGDILIPVEIPTEAYGFRLAGTQGINIQV